MTLPLATTLHLITRNMSDADKRALYAARLHHTLSNRSASSRHFSPPAPPRAIAPNPVAVKRPGSPLAGGAATRRPAPYMPRLHRVNKVHGVLNQLKHALTS